MTDFAPPPSPDEAPRALRETLAREATELDARLAEMDTLDAEKRAVEVELEKVRVAFAEERRRVLPLLEGVRSAGGCSVSWDALPGEGRVRRCARCQATVVDPRRLGGARVRALLGMEKGPLFRRPDGTMMARPCPRAARRRTIAGTIGLVVSMLLLAIVVGRAIDEARTPAARLQYLSSGSELGHRPHGIPRQVAIAPRAR